MRQQLHQRKRSEKSKSDEWWTPDTTYDDLCEEYDFNPVLDVASNGRNSKCQFYLKDALTQQWSLGDREPERNVDIWCNPPNSQLQTFMLRAYNQWTLLKKYRTRIMMIVPANTMSSKAFWQAIEIPHRQGEKVMYEPIYKRIAFLDNGKKPKFSARNAYIVVIWGKKSRF